MNGSYQTLGSDLLTWYCLRAVKNLGWEFEELIITMRAQFYDDSPCTK